MSACDLIRQCAAQVQGLFNQINSTSDVNTRTKLGNQITQHISQCVTALGRPNTKISVDQIRFHDTGVVYDVIENLKGTKGNIAQVSCHKNISMGTNGGGGGGYIPPSSPAQGFEITGNTIKFNGYAVSITWVVVVGALLLIILMKK